MSKNIGILNKLKHFLPPPVKLMIYNSLISSHLNFGILAWGLAKIPLGSPCDRIVKLQKKAVRIVTNSSYNAHTEPILKDLKLLKVSDIFRLQQLKFYYKHKKQTLPQYLNNIPLQHINEIHNYPTRSSFEMRHPKLVHKYARNFIRYSIPETFNSTPECIRSKIITHSLQGFANYIKLHFLNTYIDTCTKDNCWVCSNS